MSLSVGGVRWSEVAPKALIGKRQIPKKRAVPGRLMDDGMMMSSAAHLLPTVEQQREIIKSIQVIHCSVKSQPHFELIQHALFAYPARARFGVYR